MIKGLFSRFREKFYDSRLYDSLLNITENFRYYTGKPHYVRAKASKYEIREKYRRIVFSFLGICFFAFLIIYSGHWLSFFNRIQENSLDASDWLGFISSYWGAIIGGVLSGLITIITTSMIINRSYKVDYHRERIENMPIFLISICKSIKSDPAEFVREGECYAAGGISSEALIMTIKNVGRGIALGIRTAGFSDPHEEASIPTIVVNEEKYLVAQLPAQSCCDSDNEYESSNFSITYTDIFENKYEQRFLVCESKSAENIAVMGYVPKLIEKTERARYVQ